MRSYSLMQMKLEKKELELQKKLQNIKRDISQSHTTDWPDQAQERENDEVLNQLGLRTEQTIIEVKAALDRMKNGAYGNCLECGKTIAVARLNIKPEAKFCTHCVLKNNSR